MKQLLRKWENFKSTKSIAHIHCLAGNENGKNEYRINVFISLGIDLNNVVVAHVHEWYNVRLLHFIPQVMYCI